MEDNILTQLFDIGGVFRGIKNTQALAKYHNAIDHPVFKHDRKSLSVLKPKMRNTIIAETNKFIGKRKDALNHGAGKTFLANFNPKTFESHMINFAVDHPHASDLHMTLESMKETDALRNVADRTSHDVKENNRLWHGILIPEPLPIPAINMDPEIVKNVVHRYNNLVDEARKKKWLTGLDTKDRMELYLKKHGADLSQGDAHALYSKKGLGVLHERLDVMQGQDIEHFWNNIKQSLSATEEYFKMEGKTFMSEIEKWLILGVVVIVVAGPIINKAVNVFL